MGKSIVVGLRLQRVWRRRPCGAQNGTLGWRSRFDSSDDRLGHLRGREFTAEVRREIAIGKCAFDGGADRGGGFFLAEPVEHHGRTENRAGGIRDALPGDIRRRPVHRLEERRVAALGIEIRRGIQAEAAGDPAGEIAEDVAEEV